MVYMLCNKPILESTITISSPCKDLVIASRCLLLSCVVTIMHTLMERYDLLRTYYMVSFNVCTTYTCVGNKTA